MNHKKIITGVVITGLTGFFISCGAFFFAPNFIDLNKYKASVFETVKKETGYEVQCENIELKRSFYPAVNVRLFHTVVLYPDGEIFLKLKETDLTVKILPLLLKKLEIKKINLNRPVIGIILYKDFSTSLEKFSLKDKEINTRGFKVSAIPSKIKCNDYKIKINDFSINKELYFEGNELILKHTEKNDKISVNTKGALYFEKQKHIDYDIDVITDLTNKNTHFTFSPFKTIIDSNVTANIYSKIKIDNNNKLFGDLRIENLSLKADNLLMKNNSLKINFKGEEFSINSVLHTSDKDTVTLKGNASYGAKKFVDINAVARNVKTENLCILADKTSEILNFENPLKDITVTGIADADFNVKSDFKKLKSSGSAKLYKTVIKHKSLPYSITDINADIDFNNNKILIKDATAKVNDTPVNIKGEINEDVSYKIEAYSSGLNAYNVIRMFDFDKNLPFKVNKGNLSFNLSAEGVLNKKNDFTGEITSSGISLTEKTKNINSNIEKLKLNFKGNEKKYTGTIEAYNTDIFFGGQKYSLPESVLNFDENRITIQETPTGILPLNIKFKGEITDYIKKPAGNITFNGNIPAQKLYETGKKYVKLPAKPSGNIVTSGNIAFKDEDIRINAKLNADKNNYISYLVIRELLNKPSYLNIDAVLNKKGISIKDLSLYDSTQKKRTAVISGEIENSSVLKNLKIKIPDYISGMTNIFGGEDFSVKGDFTVNDTINNPDIKGILYIAKYGIKKHSTEVKNARIEFNGHSLKFNAPEIKIYDTVINVSGDASVNNGDTVLDNIKISGTHLDVNYLFNAFYPKINPRTLSHITIKDGLLNVNSLKILDLKATGVNSGLKFDNNSLFLKNITANAYGGKVTGEGSYNFNTNKITANCKGTNIDIKTSLFDLTGFEDNIGGRADFTANVSMYTGLYKSVIKTLSGNAEFTSRNGRIGTLGKFQYYLSAKNIMYHGFMNTTLNRLAGALSKEDTAQYREASGKIKFKEGYIFTDGIKTSGNKMSLFIKGKYNILTGSAGLEIYGRISDEIKSKLGSFGNISVADMVNSKQSKKENIIIPVSQSIIDNIPSLYNIPGAKSNLFKVNVSGNIKAVNSIHDFNWVVPDGSQKQIIKQPEPVSDEPFFEEEEEKQIEKPAIKETKPVIKEEKTEKEDDTVIKKGERLPGFSDLGL